MNRRVPHTLRPVRSGHLPTTHLFFDIEATTTPLNDHETHHTMRLGWCCYWRRRPDKDHDTVEWQPVHTPDELWDCVISHTNTHTPLYTIAHNIQYDLQVTHGLEHLQQRGYQIASVFVSGSSVIIRLTAGKRAIVLLDNMNWYRCSLAELGDVIGLPKLTVDLQADSDELLSTYCQRDVEIMLRAWQLWYQFITQNDLGRWGMTLPSQAFNAYRHRFMAHKLVVHDNEKALALERAAYRGGRVSVFVRGERTDSVYYKLDINSAYPYVMARYPYPTVLLDVYPSCTHAELHRCLQHYCAIAHVTLETQDNVYPVRYNGHNVYPVGRFDTTLTTPELIRALENGDIVSIHTIAVYRRARIFTPYVEYFYSLKNSYRQDGNRPFAELAKLLLNSLYGKFGQRAYQWERVSPDEDIVTEPGTYASETHDAVTHVYRLGNELWTYHDVGEAYHSMPAIAAHVTAYGRMFLTDLIEQAGKPHVLYVDTDSLIVDEQGYQNLKPHIHPHQLGALKIEGIYTEVEIVAPKLYRTGENWYRKGVPPHATPVEEDAFSFEVFPSLLSKTPRSPHAPYATRTLIRRLSGRVYDGHVNPDGTVAPLTLPAPPAP